jgi:ribosomal protein S6
VRAKRAPAFLIQLTPANPFVTLSQMDSEAISRNYELTYHLNSDIEEADVRKHVQELEDIVTQNSASVLTSREPKKKHLSYPLKHKHYSYFGWIDFSGSPEVIEKVTAQLKLQSNLMRYMITEKPNEKGLRVLGTERPRSRIKTHEAGTVGRDDAKPKEEVKPEQLEKEIEDVLEKI